MLKFLGRLLGPLIRLFGVGLLKQGAEGIVGREIDVLVDHNPPDRLRGQIKSWILKTGNPLTQAIKRFGAQVKVMADIDKIFDRNSDKESIRAALKAWANGMIEALRV